MCANGRVVKSLSERPAANAIFKRGHYVIPDTNVFLHCMDVLEHASAFYDVIVLQVVLEEVRARSLPLYTRLRSLTGPGDKRFYVFYNEFRTETHVRRLPGETINDRNDRAVRTAAAWYRSHLLESVGESRAPGIVMISDDKGNLEKAKREGIDCCSRKFAFVSQEWG